MKPIATNSVHVTQLLRTIIKCRENILTYFSSKYFHLKETPFSGGCMF